jgi:hypothetical protein
VDEVGVRSLLYESDKCWHSLFRLACVLVYRRRVTGSSGVEV